MSDLVISANEQATLAAKRAELAEWEARLAHAEPALVNLKANARLFEQRYLQVIGSKYHELAEIEGEIAKAQGLTLDNEIENEDWLNGESLADDEVGCGQNRLHSDRVKKLYREFARKFHPDLAESDEARLHCNHLMVEANRAYESGSVEALESLIEAGKLQDDLLVGSPELIVLTRRVQEAKAKVIECENEIAELTDAEMYRLQRRVEQADALGIDLFADLLLQVERQIKKARNRLEALQGVMMTA
jgi:hypothetical protein